MSVSEPLEQLLIQSKQIYSLAVAKEWEEAEILEVKRRKLLEACFPPQVKFDDPLQAAGLIREIIELDKKVMALGIEARKVIGGALKGIQQGRQATEVYRQVGS